MIKIHLSRILGEKRIPQSELSKRTGIRPNTINMYYHDYIQRINRTDIDKLCKALDCRIEDLIEYIPDKK